VNNNIINEFRASQNPVQAEAMAAYMKNRFPFLGLTRPERNRLQKEFIKDCKQTAQIDWALVDACWNLAEREYQYLAVDYLIALKQNLKESDLEKIEGLITRKPWWDTVDAIADKLVGYLCLRFPELIDDYIMK